MNGALTARGVLAGCERALERARARAALRPQDATAHLRVAVLEIRRGNLLALTAYEQRPRSEAYLVWRRHALRADAEGSLARASASARAAARAARDPELRRQALLILASVRYDLGDARGEVAALRKATRAEPGNARLWLRLAAAYGRQKRFRQALRAADRAEQILVASR